MPRRSRIDAPGALHHIIVRGIERKPIFIDDADRNHFLERLENVLGDGDFVEDVLQYCRDAYDQKYELKLKGYDFDAIVSRVAEVLGIDTAEVLSPGMNNKYINVPIILPVRRNVMRTGPLICSLL